MTSAGYDRSEGSSALFEIETVLPIGWTNLKPPFTNSAIHVLAIEVSEHAAQKAALNVATGFGKGRNTAELIINNIRTGFGNGVFKIEGNENISMLEHDAGTELAAREYCEEAGDTINSRFNKILGNTDQQPGCPTASRMHLWRVTEATYRGQRCLTSASAIRWLHDMGFKW